MSEITECHDCKYGITAYRLCYLGGWDKCKGKNFERRTDK